MKTALSIIALCLSAACGGSSVASMADTGGPASLPVSPAPDQTFAGMLNNVRSSNGAAPVTYDSRLGRAAQGHANDMLRNNFFSHTGSDGSNAGQRIRREGYDPRAWGENIARGQQNEQTVLQAWVNSPGHQANNVNPNFEDFALAKAGSGSQLYWVLVLASERP